MKLSRELLERDISAEINRKLNDTKAVQRYIRNAQSAYGVPEKLFSDFVTQRKNMMEADTFMLFILSDILLGDIKTKEYFTDTEYSTLKKEKWYVSKIKFPLRFDVTEIDETHYIGKITAKELMLLKDAQIINYNVNAQRTMKHIVRGEMEYYQISLNKLAVQEILDSYESSLFIANTITLNLPENAVYSYDKKNKQLIIHNTDCLDILDGYHRYIAMSKAYSRDDKFDYDMELRIVQFSEEKARRFIWQEDQKTKMRKIDSDSMNVFKVSNKIVDRINNDSSFILAGKISRNKGIINAAFLANIIDIIYLNGIKKSDELKSVKSISHNIVNVIEDFTDTHPEYLEKPWDKILTYMVCYEDKFGKIQNIDIDLEQVRNDRKIYALSNLTKSDVTRTHKLLRKAGA